MDAEILEPSYGVTIDVDGIARVQRLGRMLRLKFLSIYNLVIRYNFWKLVNP